MGAPRCHANLVVTIAWQAQEGTQAAWNPLATTHRMDGSTDFNSVGVQNYRTLAQGLEATKETIENGWQTYGYGAVIRSMRDCADPLDTAQRDRRLVVVLRVRRRAVRGRHRARRRGLVRDLLRPVGPSTAASGPASVPMAQTRQGRSGCRRPGSPVRLVRRRQQAGRGLLLALLHALRARGPRTRSRAAHAAPAPARSARDPAHPPATRDPQPQPNRRAIVVGVVVALVVGAFVRHMLTPTTTSPTRSPVRRGCTTRSAPSSSRR